MSYADHGVGMRPGCECWRCANDRPWPSAPRRVELKWDIGPLLLYADAEELKSRYGINRWISWRAAGILDADADRLAVSLLRMHPAQIWTGWYTAALDYYGDDADVTA